MRTLTLKDQISYCHAKIHIASCYPCAFFVADGGVLSGMGIRDKWVRILIVSLIAGKMQYFLHEKKVEALKRSDRKVLCDFILKR
ncbi:MAG: hypothetical protein ABIQ40_18975 [Bacteroidia bacterium]